MGVTGRFVPWVAVGTGVAAEGAVAAWTNPFTWPANLVVTAGLVELAVAVVVQRAGRRAPGAVARRAAPVGSSELRATAGRRLAVWWALAAAGVAWELFCYASSPRSAHPTLSSVIDAAEATRPGRGVLFAAWLALGWYLVTR